MGKKPVIVNLRVYKGKELNYDENGKVKNENQSIKVFYDSVEWRNQLKNFKANGFIKVEVVSANYVTRNKDLTEELSEYDNIDVIKKEVKNAFEGDRKIVLTPEQKEIQELKAKLDAFISSSSDKKGKKPKKTEIKEKKDDTEQSIEDARAEYLEVVGKKAFGGWDFDTLKQKQEENSK